MKLTLILACLSLIIHKSIAPPPRKPVETKVEHEEEKVEHENEKEHGPMDELGVEYERYLKEVVDVLESDPEFRKKLEAAEEADIRSGKIAHELEYVNHHVRSKLDEVKRQELERLRHLAQQTYDLTNDIDVAHMKIAPPEHLDHDNPHTFEIEDLKKLIAKVDSDLYEADKKRKEEFKEYEMQKEYEKQEKLKHLEGEEKDAFEKELKDNETKHKQHEKLHHPGSKQQLEEVWEKQDHMTDQAFDPKIFFKYHDLDGNGYWDQDEVKTLFLKELDKLYQVGVPEDDMRERAEEMERMREHVFLEADKNGDHLISFKEFLDETQKPEFEKDDGWESIDQQQIYSPEEYAEFERRRQEEVQRLIQQGIIPPQPVYHGQPYYHPQGQQFPPGHPAQQGGQGYYKPKKVSAIKQLHPAMLMEEEKNDRYRAQLSMQGHPGQVPHPAQYQQQAGQYPPVPAQHYPQHGQQYPHGQIQPGQQYPQGQPQPQLNPQQAQFQGAPVQHPQQAQFQGAPVQHPQQQYQPQQAYQQQKPGQPAPIQQQPPQPGQFAQGQPNQVPQVQQTGSQPQQGLPVGQVHDVKGDANAIPNQNFQNAPSQPAPAVNNQQPQLQNNQPNLAAHPNDIGSQQKP